MSTPRPAAQLVAIAENLYGMNPADFTQARNAEAATAKAAHDGELAAAIRKLRRPSVAAWAVNQLVRRERDQIIQVLELGDSLRSAAAELDGDELRALTKQRRQLTALLTTTARRIASSEGSKTSKQVATHIEDTLTAAMMDPLAAQAVLTGLLVTSLTATGIDHCDVDAVVAVPASVGGVVAAPVRASLSVVEPDLEEQRADMERQLEEHQVALDHAHGLTETARSQRERLDARRLQVHADLDELRRRMASLEDDLEEVDDDIDAADAEVEEAAEMLAQAQQGMAQTQAALDKLGGS